MYMKTIFILILLFSGPIYSQNDQNTVEQSREQRTEAREPAQDEIPPEEDIRPIDETEVIDEAENKEEEKAQKEECVCPQEEQAQDSLSTIFPSGSVFIISPEAQKQEEKVIPYPTAPLPSGYSDDQYRNIGGP